MIIYLLPCNTQLCWLRAFVCVRWSWQGLIDLVMTYFGEQSLGINSALSIYRLMLGVCKNIRSEISDPKIRWSEILDIRSDLKISDISDRVSGKNFGFSDRIRIEFFQKFQSTRSENLVIRSENPVFDPKTRYSIRKPGDPIRKFRIGFGSQFPPIRNFRISEFSDPIRYPTLNTPSWRIMGSEFREFV